MVKDASSESFGNGYQDLVIKDGKLVGDWQTLYKNFGDPWKQSDSNIVNES